VRAAARDRTAAGRAAPVGFFRRGSPKRRGAFRFPGWRIAAAEIRRRGPGMSLSVSGRAAGVLRGYPRPAAGSPAAVRGAR